ncbi:tRNA-dihydrouridine(16/17) synthase [NAD(P)(+)] [Malassezia psittaci]|uniref:tRNA-dihydrouridine(16/17) synthase [NAD(P)(+)] n=1 Tax=Malassezia psittaci TaxID=1821823 RepID=A0AAF0JFA1_9BASI|nr:tRNA-dihydrouridine(16/17) synthase [NAD(P)(+)] [Malassezia psittaci]
MSSSSDSSEIPDLDSFPETGTPKYPKLGGYAFYKSIGSPQRLVAPMVDQSELAWRVLSRRYGSQLVYTPMINAKVYVQKNKGARRVQETYFNQALGEEGAFQLDLGKASDTDRPLIVQFCANNPEQLLEAAQSVQDKCDAVDLNLGCPQQIAKRGNFGAFLQEDWQLIFQLINTLHLELKIPVTAKFRVYESLDKTLAYAKMIQRAGAQMVTVHGRTREMKGHKTGLADWEKIRSVKQALSIPVFANGNMLFPQDWRDALEYTSCDGVMSAEGNLYNPTLFSDMQQDLGVLARQKEDRAGFDALRITRVAHEYLDIVAALRTPTAPSALKGHMFKMTRPALAIHTDLRAMLGQARSDDHAHGEERVKEYRAFVQELEKRLLLDEADQRYYNSQGAPRYYVTPEHLKDASDLTVRPEYIPHWYLQPYFRPPLNPPKEKMQTEAHAGASDSELPSDKTSHQNHSFSSLPSSLSANIDSNHSLADQPPNKNEAKGVAIQDAPLAARLNEAKTLKTLGNTQFEQKKYAVAVTHYTDALAQLPPRPLSEQEEDQQGSEKHEAIEEIDDAEADRIIEQQTISLDDHLLFEEVAELRVKLYANLAASHLKLVRFQRRLMQEQYEKTIDASTQVLLEDSTNVKALHRRAVAHEKLGGWGHLNDALKDYRHLESLDKEGYVPTSFQSELKQSVDRVQQSVQQAGEKEKTEVLGKLKTLGDNVLGYFGLSTNNFQLNQQEGGGYSLNFVQ